MREQRLEPALSGAGIEHPLTPGDLRSNTVHEGFDCCFEGIQAIVQPARDETLQQSHQSGIKQALRLSVRDCRAYRARSECVRHPGSAFRSEVESCPDLS